MAAISSLREINHCHRPKSKSMALICSMQLLEDNDDYKSIDGGDPDYISKLPDECLAYIFQSLSSGDQKHYSLVCHRWFRIEGQSRHRLSLNAQSDLYLLIDSLFSRFVSMMKLALKCNRRSVSICDEALVLISFKCRNLTRLKLRVCPELIDVGMEAFAKDCKGLKKFSCDRGSFQQSCPSAR